MTGNLATACLTPETIRLRSYHLVAGIWSAGSEHTGGAQFVLADGSVRLITDNIDTGNLSVVAPPRDGGGLSPYGVWDAMGTRAAGEVAAMEE